MPAPGVDPVRMRYGEALRIGWLIAWRGALLNALVLWIVVPVFALGVTGILTTLGLPAIAVEGVMAAIRSILIPLAMNILLLQMALMKDFQGFRLETQNQAGEADDWSLKETIVPGLFLWLFGILGYIVCMPIIALLLSRGQPAPIAWSPVIVVSALAAYPAAAFTLTIMRFHGRKLAVIREQPLAADPVMLPGSGD